MGSSNTRPLTRWSECPYFKAISAPAQRPIRMASFTPQDAVSQLSASRHVRLMGLDKIKAVPPASAIADTGEVESKNQVP